MKTEDLTRFDDRELVIRMTNEEARYSAATQYAFDQNLQGLLSYAEEHFSSSKEQIAELVEWYNDTIEELNTFL